MAVMIKNKETVLMAVSNENARDVQRQSFDECNAVVMAMADALGPNHYDAADQKAFADEIAGF